ncbi:MAG: HlyC/CorC family transporter [Acidobacteria bacterium]|nr:HlyC/CorC family transporter [Acidobacteriota bacterium]
MMHFLLAILIFLSSLLLALFSYVNRLYSEKERFLIRGSKDNVDFFENQIEPRLRLAIEKAELTFPFLVQMNVVLLTLLVIAWNVRQPLRWETVLQTALFLVLDVVLFAQAVPHVLLTRTTGKWLLVTVRLLRISIWLAVPFVAISQFLHHVATLGKEEKEVEEPSANENIEALMVAGEEGGLWEKEDRQLIRSVVEFGDKTVREVMTSRPEIFAVPADTPLSQLKQKLAERHFSRIPVYDGNLDHMVGFVRARDLLQWSDADLARKTVRQLVQPLTFVPETKPVADLLKEIQQKAPLAIVVDEYGSVAGLVTVEDMVEEIVGEIRDESEALDVIQQGEGIYSVPGNMDLDRLQELFGVRIDDEAGATTVSGLVTNLIGRVPNPGERMEKEGLVFRITESNGRRVLRLQISGPTANVSTRSDTPPKVTTGNSSS